MEMIAFLYFLVGVILAVAFVFGSTSEAGREQLSSMVPYNLEHIATLLGLLVTLYFVLLIFFWPLFLMKLSFEEP